jgi:branched-chain amino acid transport system permease protein
MLGAYVAVWIGTNAALGPGPGAIIAILAGAIAGVLLYVIVLRRLRQEEMLAIFIATLGVSFFVQHLVARIVGPDTRASKALFQSSFHDIGGVKISDAQFLLLGAMAVIAIALIKWIGLSRIGRDMRAVAENGFLARVVGVNVVATMVITIAVASGIAAAGAVLVTNVTQTVSPFLATEIALKMFIVALVAGAGSVGGAVIAGLGLGIAESFAVAYLGSSWQHVVGLVILVIVLMIRPQGLFGRAARIG